MSNDDIEEDVELEEIDLERILAGTEPDVPQGAQWFDAMTEDLHAAQDAYARREARRDGMVSRRVAPITAWFEREARPIAERVAQIEAAIKARMLDYREATGQKLYKGPHARIASRTVPQRLLFPKDDTSLICTLASIDRSTFVRDKTVSSVRDKTVSSVRDKTVSSVDKDNVTAAAVVKDGRAYIDGIELPDVMIADERIDVAISPLPVKDGF